MSLEIKKEGYTVEESRCPNCSKSLTLYLDEKGIIRKALWAELLGKNNEIKCDYCESILSYKPKK